MSVPNIPYININITLSVIFAPKSIHHFFRNLVLTLDFQYKPLERTCKLLTKNIEHSINEYDKLLLTKVLFFTRNRKNTHLLNDFEVEKKSAKQQLLKLQSKYKTYSLKNDYVFSLNLTY